MSTNVFLGIIRTADGRSPIVVENSIGPIYMIELYKMKALNLRSIPQLVACRFTKDFLCYFPKA